MPYCGIWGSWIARTIGMFRLRSRLSRRMLRGEVGFLSHSGKRRSHGEHSSHDGWMILGTRGKVTSNVRRILQSQKIFRNHLEDEEAFLSQSAQQTTGGGGGPAGGAGATTAQAQRPAINRITKPAQRRSSTPITMPKTESAMRQRKRTPAAPSSTAAETPETPAAATDTAGPAEGAPPTPPPTDTQHLISSEYDNDPLLRSRMPPVPSDRIMQALLSEPPLPYNASRAGPPLTRKSPRFFCAICGYWGKIRCRGCHVRTCGLGCYKVHEESRCGAFL